MKSFIKIYLLIVLFPLYISCSDMNSGNKESIINKLYVEEKNNLPFPKELIAHFPNKLENSRNEFILRADPRSKYSYFILLQRMEDSILVAQCKDSTCDSEYSKYSLYKLQDNSPQIEMVEALNNNKILLPSFNLAEESAALKENYSETSSNGLIDGFKLSKWSGSSIYSSFNSINNKLILDKLSKPHNKGYSYGIFVNCNKNQIIYWVIAF